MANQVRRRALLSLLRYLEAARYDFVTPTPAACQANLARQSRGSGLRDALGWSRIFEEQALDPRIVEWLAAADALEPAGGGWRSRLRVSRLHGRLYLHSAFPTDGECAVFLGPDSYRFADLILREMADRPAPHIVFDVGAGAGVGGVTAQQLAPQARIFVSDVNAAALELADINATHAGFAPIIVQAPGLEGAPDEIDLIVMNPPYIAGAAGHVYKDGGDLQGARLSLDWALEAMRRLPAGGRAILYSGSAILDGGFDRLKALLRENISASGFTLEYREIDPDVFSEELRREAYRGVERIAAIAAVITRR